MMMVVVLPHIPTMTYISINKHLFRSLGDDICKVVSTNSQCQNYFYPYIHLPCSFLHTMSTYLGYMYMYPIIMYLQSLFMHLDISPYNICGYNIFANYLLVKSHAMSHCKMSYYIMSCTGKVYSCTCTYPPTIYVDTIHLQIVYLYVMSYCIT